MTSTHEKIVLHDLCIPESEREDHRRTATDLMQAICVDVYNVNTVLDEDGPPLLIQHAARIYASLPEVYQVAILQVCKSRESTSTEAHDIREFGLWQIRLARTMDHDQAVERAEEIADAKILEMAEEQARETLEEQYADKFAWQVEDSLDYLRSDFWDGFYKEAYDKALSDLNKGEQNG